METELLLDVAYTLNPNLLSSIKSVDSVAVRSGHSMVELSLAFFEVLMAFAEKKTARQAFESLDVDVDLERFGAIIQEFHERGLLRRDVPAEEGDSLRDFVGDRLSGDPALGDKIASAMRAGRAIVIPDALPVSLADRVHDELDRNNGSSARVAMISFIIETALLSNSKRMTAGSPNAVGCSRAPRLDDSSLSSRGKIALAKRTQQPPGIGLANTPCLTTTLPLMPRAQSRTFGI